MDKATQKEMTRMDRSEVLTVISGRCDSDSWIEGVKDALLQKTEKVQ
jgi:hypothetical protein